MRNEKGKLRGVELSFVGAVSTALANRDFSYRGLIGELKRIEGQYTSRLKGKRRLIGEIHRRVAEHLL